MSRPTIPEIVAESGISRATVDRVLHNRPGVHPRTRIAVERAIERLEYRDQPTPERPEIDFALRLGAGLIHQIEKLAPCLGDRKHRIHNLHQLNDADVLRKIRDLCADVTRPLVVTVKETAPVVAELARARRRGKTVIAMISDLPSEARDAYVGINNRAAGETAAVLIGRALGDRPTTVGLVLGDHAYRCHQDREIGFRHALRTQYPRVALIGEAVGKDSPLVTRNAVLDLLEEHPGIGALYNASGGKTGMAEAIAMAGRTHDILAITHEVNSITVPLIQDGKMDYLISQDPRDMLREAVRIIDAPRAGQLTTEHFVDFGVYTRANLPSYGTTLIA